MALDTQSKVCLDIAVDHRIRLLFKPVSANSTEHSNHVSRIKSRGLSLKRSYHEIGVTAKLAGPESKGGITVVLQQPRHNHPFKDGLDTVINDCETLCALDDVFTAVSCGTLNIRTDITIIDLLPFMSQDVKQIDDINLRESFRASGRAICDKEPDVLLCAGKIWLPRVGKNDDRKGDAWRFESIGVGERFDSIAKLLSKARIRHEDGGLVTIRRVNGFHPSYAVNHLPHVGVLRQLQILTGAETCGMLRGDWEEKEWMDELRRNCQKISKSVSASPSKSPSQQSPGKSSVSRNSTKYLPDYQVLYSDALLNLLQASAEPMLFDSRLVEKSPGVFYETLLSSCLSAKCNDASLILRQMSRLQRRGWPDSVAWKNEAAIRDAAVSTLQFAENVLRIPEKSNDAQLVKAIRHCARSCQEHVVTGRSGRRPEYELDLRGTRDEFLKLATKIEALLLDFLLRNEKKALRQEDLLSSMMGKMNLGPAAVSKTPVSPLPAPAEKPRWWRRGRRS
ncbi:hypothetical protein BFJ63_vAg18651 [Fusarium oxysporum f. sp. narcissi]|uniref:Uncharacterized protein n=1 Tax=Fusarium oxysporum f. sp. narcissi TaxID=451672 RepID=A0A4Q2UVS7_FUSOX|nr:hypothetical protein BFJ63_vAg18651 [Fusarium oxysporum f. sp. narcissi]